MNVSTPSLNIPLDVKGLQYDCLDVIGLRAVCAGFTSCIVGDLFKVESLDDIAELGPVVGKDVLRGLNLAAQRAFDDWTQDRRELRAFMSRR